MLERLFDPSRGRDIGLFALRVGLGFMFILHGWPKMTGGPEKWEAVGSAMRFFGLDSGHTLFGFLAAFAELGGGLLLVVTMVVATVKHVAQGDSFGSISHPIETGLGALALLLGGAGRWSLDEKIAAWLRARQ